MRAATLPPVFGPLCAQLLHVQQVGPNEYSSECPSCGGGVHQNGEAPDRFRLFVDGHARAWCRRCGYFVWADQAAGTNKPTAEELSNWRADQIIREEARKRSAELALSNLRRSELWERYYADLGEVGRQYWQGRGIPTGWQDFWRLGWCAASRWNTPTATIPIFTAGWNVVNIKHRLIQDDGKGKYRYELHGVPNVLYLTDPDAPIAGQVIAVEGEIKAMVVKATLDDSTIVLGLPGLTPCQNALDQLISAERVVLVLDPGSDTQARELAAKIGNGKCRIVIPPMKVDDGINASSMTARELRLMLRSAQ